MAFHRALSFPSPSWKVLGNAPSTFSSSLTRNSNLRNFSLSSHKNLPQKNVFLQNSSSLNANLFSSSALSFSKNFLSRTNFYFQPTSFMTQRFFTLKVTLPAPLPPITPNLNTKFQPVENSFAIVHISGHQYKVCAGDVLMIEKIEADIGKEIFLPKVLLVGTESLTQIGTPLVQEAKVLAVIEEQTLADKVIIFKKKRRKGYKRHRGHRQPFTRLRIKGIYFDPTIQPSATVQFTKREPVHLVN